jgi:hypothetical protein
LSKIRAAAAIIDTFTKKTDETNIRSLRETFLETIAANCCKVRRERRRGEWVQNEKENRTDTCGV